VLVYPNELEVGLNYYTRALPTPLEIATVPAKYPAVAMARPYLGSNKGAPAAIESDRGEIARMLSQHRKVWFVGDWSGPDAKLNVVNSELYRERGEPVSSVDFAGTRITLFAEK
jgi:mannosyltransferase